MRICFDRGSPGHEVTVQTWGRGADRRGILSESLCGKGVSGDDTSASGSSARAALRTGGHLLFELDLPQMTAEAWPLAIRSDGTAIAG